MDVFERAASAAASADGEPLQNVSGLVAMATTTSAKQEYAYATGMMSVGPEQGFTQKLDCNTVMWLASATKLMTAVAVMSCVERGLISLDENVVRVLPELKTARILEGFDKEGNPQLRFPTHSITLRRLLSHCSGIGYDTANPLLVQWQGGESRTFCGDFEKAFSKVPLCYEPGKGWQYGAGFDWAGKIVERLNNCTLGQYLQKTMWGPLKMDSTTFHIESRLELEMKLATIVRRSESGGSEILPHEYARVAKDDSGGHGVFSTASDFLKLLNSLLRKDGKVLKPETTDILFAPQLEPCIVELMMESLRNPSRRLNISAGQQTQMTANFSFAGYVTLMDRDTGRRAGSVQWGGYPNISWWIDFAGGCCGVFFSQILPPQDQKTMELKSLFERAIYFDWMCR